MPCILDDFLANLGLGALLQVHGVGDIARLNCLKVVQIKRRIGVGLPFALDEYVRLRKGQRRGTHEVGGAAQQRRTESCESHFGKCSISY